MNTIGNICAWATIIAFMVLMAGVVCILLYIAVSIFGILLTLGFIAAIVICIVGSYHMQENW